MGLAGAYMASKNSRTKPLSDREAFRLILQRWVRAERAFDVLAAVNFSLTKRKKGKRR